MKQRGLEEISPNSLTKNKENSCSFQVCQLVFVHLLIMLFYKCED